MAHSTNNLLEEFVRIGLDLVERATCYGDTPRDPAKQKSQIFRFDPVRELCDEPPTLETPWWWIFAPWLRGLLQKDGSAWWVAIGKIGAVGEEQEWQNFASADLESEALKRAVAVASPNIMYRDALQSAVYLSTFLLDDFIKAQKSHHHPIGLLLKLSPGLSIDRPIHCSIPLVDLSSVTVEPDNEVPGFDDVNLPGDNGTPIPPIAGNGPKYVDRLERLAEYAERTTKSFLEAHASADDDNSGRRSDATQDLGDTPLNAYKTDIECLQALVSQEKPRLRKFVIMARDLVAPELLSGILTISIKPPTESMHIKGGAAVVYLRVHSSREDGT